ncbi:MAG: hypothetical protein OQJ81_02720 [Melioribacteraceae bacterium]|nr:hypothetical protein [Melioribacteraceae bacterium]
MKSLIYSATLIIIFVFLLISCGPLNPVNDFFGIQMNPDEETNFEIVSYSDSDGISYKNSISMNPKINAWAEITAQEIILKIVNNSEKEIPLSYTTDQFILITEDGEYYLGKGGRADYFSRGGIAPKTSQMFNLDLPLEYGNIARSGSGKVSARSVIRNYSKEEGHLSLQKDSVKYFIVKFGKVSIVLKRIPQI